MMVDIETLDNKSHAAVLWIAGQFFNMEDGDQGASFNVAVNIKSNLNAGLNVNAETALWWMKKEDALQAWTNAKKHDLAEALDLFSEFIDENTKDQDFEIWGNSNRFDMGILDNAYSILNKKLPWKFRNERDVRTLVSFNPQIKEDMIKGAKEAGVTLHDPLVDARLQIMYCVATYKTLRSCQCP